MTGPDFTTALIALNLDNHQAAQWLGVSVKSVRRYRVSGAPGPVAGMVRLGLAVLPVFDVFPLSASHIDAIENAMGRAE